MERFHNLSEDKSLYVLEREKREESSILLKPISNFLSCMSCMKDLLRKEEKVIKGLIFIPLIFNGRNRNLITLWKNIQCIPEVIMFQTCYYNIMLCNSRSRFVEEHLKDHYSRWGSILMEFYCLLVLYPYFSFETL